MIIKDWKKELRDYIERVLSLGFSESQIQAALKKAGWKEEYVADGFRDVFFLRDMRVTHNTVRTMRADHAAAISKKKISRSRTSGYYRSPTSETNVLLLSSPKNALSARILLSLPATKRSAALFLPAPSLSFRILKWIIRRVEHVFDALERFFRIVVRMVLFPVAIITILIKIFRSRTSEDFRSPTSETFAEEKESPLPEHVRGRDVLRLAGRVFRARRLRTFLTMLGMSVGIGTILFLVSLGYGLERILFERITNADALLTLDAFAPSDNTVIQINEGLINEIGRAPFVEKTSALALVSGEIVREGYAVAGSLYAADPDYLQLSGITAEAGVLDVTADSGVVISSAAANLLGFSSLEKAVGAQVRFVVSLPSAEEGKEEKTFWLDSSYTVRGIIEDKFSVFAYLPLSALTGRGALSYSQLKIKVDAAEHLDAVREKTLSFGLLVSALSETVDQAEKIFTVAKIALALFGVITLVVSAIGMFNTMTIALLERTQEVGIMKAIGASNFDIWKLFLAEAMIMGLIGGMGGIVIGYIGAQAFNWGINALASAFGGQSLNLFQTPLWFLFTIIAFSAAVGVITGLWPAYRASKLSPIDALKNK